MLILVLVLVQSILIMFTVLAVKVTSLTAHIAPSLAVTMVKVLE